MAKLTIDQALQRGIEAHKAGHVQEAERLYTAILKVQPKHPDANHNMGVIAVGVGKVEQALQFFKMALGVNPSKAQFWLSYIDALIKFDKLTEAKALLDQAKSKGAKGDGFNKLEQRLQKAGQEPLLAKQIASEPQPKQPNILDTLKLGEAIKLAKKKTKGGSIEDSKRIYKDILKRFPANKRANIGLKSLSSAPTGKFQKISDISQDQQQLLINLYNQRHLQQALDQAKGLLELFPHSILLHNICGAVYAAFKQYDAAIDSYTRALKLNPDLSETHNNMGLALKDKGNLDAAIESYKQALKFKPDYAEAHNNMGIALKDKENLDAAIESYKQALKFKPDLAEAHYNMGIALKGKGNIEAAIESYKQALKFKPDYAAAHNNMGITLKDKGDLDAAIESYKHALKIEPNYADAHYNLSFALLNSGRFKEGFDEHEWRWKKAENLSHLRHFSQPLWDGEKSLKDKRILLWSEQGVGDTIIWSSCLSHVASKAEHCILECQEKLVPLLARSFPNVEVKPENRNSDPQREDFDFHLPMGSLYKHFISEVSENTKPNAFLIPDPIRVKFWQRRLNSLGNGPYVGVSWKSAIMSPIRLPNYAPLSEWSPIFKLPYVTFINLQYVDFLRDLKMVQNDLGVTIHNFNDLDHYDDIDDVAALCAALDMVISTKSTVPLISAGVGTLTKLATWRQSPWNNILSKPIGPSVDVYEKDTREPWNAIFKPIAADISKLIDDSSGLKCS